MHRGNYVRTNGAIPPNTNINKPSPGLPKDSDTTHFVRPDAQPLSDVISGKKGHKPTPFISYSEYDNTIRPLAHGLKTGKSDSIIKAAELMSPMIAKAAHGRQCVLLPVPGHNGTAGYTKDLCDAIGTRINMQTADVLTGNRHIALYHAKKNEMKADGIPIVFRQKEPLPENVIPIVVDNVLDTGHTAMAAVKALASEETILAVLGNTRRYADNKEACFVQMDKGLPQRTKGKKKGKSRITSDSAKKKTSKKKVSKKSTAKSNPVKEVKTKTTVIRSRAPQLITVNGEKVTHAHAFESSTNPGTWYFTARIDSTQLRPKLMRHADMEILREGREDVEKLMRTYYPTKLLPKVSKEEFQSDIYLSDGRRIDKFNIFKERDENREDFGKYKMYVEAGGTKLSVLMDVASLDKYFDRVTTPARLVEDKLGERLHLATAYRKYALPDPSPVSDIRIFKDTDNLWKISADFKSHSNRLLAVPVSNTDLQSFFETHTVTREQLAAKYLMPAYERMQTVGASQSVNNDNHQPSDMNVQEKTNAVNENLLMLKAEPQGQTNTFQEYFEGIKSRHPDVILLFRGQRSEYYECFNEDARSVANTLRTNVTTLTNVTPYIRNKAYFPHHALDTNLPKLISAGFRIAIMDGAPLELLLSTNDKIKNMNSTERKPQVRQEEALETKKSSKKTAIENVGKTESVKGAKTVKSADKVKPELKTTKEERDLFTATVVAVAGKNNHAALNVKLPQTPDFTVLNAKGNKETLEAMHVLRGRVTFTNSNGDKLQLTALSNEALNNLKPLVEPLSKDARQKKDTQEKVDDMNAVKTATKEQRENFVKDIKELMGNTKSVALPDFGTKEGVVASLGNEGVSVKRVTQFEDNVSFTATIPGKDGKELMYIHPKDIRPEFYDILKNDVAKAMQPQMITENGGKVTNAVVFPAKDDASKHIFMVNIDGVRTHPKVVSAEDAAKFHNRELTVKDMMEKYYPAEIAKKLDQNQFNDKKLSDGRELTTFHVYKQDKPDKPHYKEWMVYAEIGDKRLHALPMSSDIKEAYFNRTISKGMTAEKVLGEQLHLKSAYEKYKLPEEAKGAVIRKSAEGKFLVSAVLQDGRKTAEKALTGNDIYAYAKQIANKDQMAGKYLSKEIKELAATPLSQKKEEHHRGIGR